MVIKFNPQGRVTMVFGRKKQASDEAVPAGAEGLRAADNASNIYVADRGDRRI
jgi:hypothetical protein